MILLISFYILGSQVHVLANEVMRKQYVFPGAKDQTAKTVQEYLGVGLKTAAQPQVFYIQHLFFALQCIFSDSKHSKILGLSKLEEIIWLEKFFVLCHGYQNQQLFPTISCRSNPPSLPHIQHHWDQG